MFPGGDDDLFINKVANRQNTNIVIDPDTFTLSEPKKTFRDWVKQKTRHYTTGKYYKARHKFLLGLYSLTSYLILPGICYSACFMLHWTWTALLFSFFVF